MKLKIIFKQHLVEKLLKDSFLASVVHSWQELSAKPTNGNLGFRKEI
jgi:hypothetical protein